MEIINIGVDIEEVSRFVKLDDKILNRLFTKGELFYCLKQKNYAQNLAVRYCAKEATFKALPFDKISLKKIEVIKDTNGAPRIKIADIRADGLSFKVSLSHTKDYAVASVLVYKK